MSDRMIFPEVAKKNVSKVGVPECMREENLPKLDKNAKDLNDSETKLASKSLINQDFINLDFPKRLKTRVDPVVDNQKYFVSYFIPAKDAVPGKNGVFGYSRIRYVAGTKDEAYAYSEKIIKTFDSVNENVIGFVGKDFPITTSTDYCKTTKEVDIRMGMDETARLNFQKQKEAEDKEVREIQERQRKLIAKQKNPKESSKESPEDLDYYITLVVKRANIEVAFDKLAQQKLEYEKLYSETKNEMDNLSTKYPDYKKKYMDKYKQSLETCGANVHDNPLIEKMAKFAL